MQNGFLDDRRTHPAGLAIVIAGHAAILTAIALVPPDTIQRIIYVPLETISIKDAPPPPPPEPARAEQRVPQETPTAFEPLVTSTDPRPFAIDPLPPMQPSVPLPPPSIQPKLLPATIDPAAMARFQPDYPPELIRADIEGTATVRVLVGSDGRVKVIELVSATQPAFFEATRRQALRFWKFKPATSDGIATESWRTMTVRFKIRG